MLCGMHSKLLFEYLRLRKQTASPGNLDAAQTTIFLEKNANCRQTLALPGFLCPPFLAFENPIAVEGLNSGAWAKNNLVASRSSRLLETLIVA
jgi:hypothetical protein